MSRDEGWGLIVFYIRVLQIPVCVLLLVQPPQRNQLCLMEFLIVCPEFESCSSWNYRRSFVMQVRRGGGREKVLHLSPCKTAFSLTRNTRGCFCLVVFFNMSGDVVKLWVKSSNAVKCRDMTWGHGRHLELIVKDCWVSASTCKCVSLRLHVTWCSMFCRGQIAK